MEVTITGQQQIINVLQGPIRAQVLRAADRGLRAAGMHIIADAQLNLRQNHTNTTGRLSQSGKVQRTKEGDGYDVGFLMGEQSYAGAVEYGRRAGKMPPVQDLRQWIRKKHSGPFNAIRSAAAFSGRSQDSLLTSVAWAVAKHIAKHGTKPHAFFAPAVQKNRQRILNDVRDAIAQIVNRPANV